LFFLFFQLGPDVMLNSSSRQNGNAKKASPR
jgi:hypothetical protein